MTVQDDSKFHITQKWMQLKKLGEGNFNLINHLFLEFCFDICSLQAARTMDNKTTD